jgi:CysZ protein
VLREFFAGFAVLGRGFALWRRRPGLMALGLIPALIVAVVAVVLIVLLAVNLQAVATFITPFANGWDPQLATFVRLVLGLALFIGAVVLVAFGFTAITLTIGDPFYERIWRQVENDLGDFPEGKEPGFWRSIVDSFRLVVRAAFTAILLALIALIPVVGTAVAAALGVFFSGRIIALEMTARPLEARGLTRVQRRAVLRSRSPRTLGFGVAVHLCFLVPGGAVLVMPAAVAGATYLARHALDATAASAAVHVRPSAAAPPVSS